MPDQEIPIAAVQNALARYCHLIDLPDVDGAIELFDPDVETHVPHAGLHLTGVAALRELLLNEQAHLLLKQRKILHISSTVNVTCDADDGSFQSISHFQAWESVAGDGPVLNAAGRYRDIWVESGDMLRVRSRTILIDMRRPRPATAN